MRKQMVIVGIALAEALGSVAVGLAPALAVAQATAPARVIEIVVDGGYQPARIVVRAGERVRLRFVRRDWSSCTREVVLPTLGIRRALPTGQPVEIDLPALGAGEHEFRCGMGMIRGTLVVEAA